MWNIFELTKREQRIVILIVVALVVIAFGRHAWHNKSPAPLNTSTPTVTPPIHHETESRDEEGD